MKHIMYHDLFEDEISEIIRSIETDCISHNGITYFMPGCLFEDGYITENRPSHHNTVDGLYMRFIDEIGNKGYMPAKSLVNKLAHDTFTVIKA